MPPTKQYNASYWPFCAEFNGTPPNGTPPVNAAGLQVWKCKLCLDRKPPKFYERVYKNGSTPIFRHLKNEHRVHLQTSKEQAATEEKAGLNLLEAWMAKSTNQEASKLAPILSARSEDAISKAELRELIMRLVADADLPFKIVRSAPFKALIRRLNSEAMSFFPYSDSTVKADLKEGFRLRQEILRDVLPQALSKIHVIPDGWTSPNKKGLLGITIQWVHTTGLQTLRLGLRELEGSHSGLATSTEILNLAGNYNFPRNVGFIIADNASPMDTAAMEMENLLSPQGIEYDAKFFRLRCFGHIINLTVQEFFFGPTATEESQQQQQPSKLPKDSDVLARFTEEDWREYGCIGKLHNIIVFVQRSPQRLSRFKALSNDLSLKRDNKTRWNSWYEAIEWALRDEIKSAISEFCSNEPKLYEDELRGTDWSLLANVRDFLKPFFKATKDTEGSRSTIDKILPSMERLLTHLEKSVSTTYKSNNFMRLRCTDAWTKLREYYERTDDTVAYFAATALNPIIKLDYFKRSWTTSALKKSFDYNKKRTQQHWELYYKDAADDQPDSTSESTPEKPAEEDNFWDDYMLQTATTKSEWQHYLSQPRIPDPRDKKWHPVDWWMEDSQRRRYPTLHKVNPFSE